MLAYIFAHFVIIDIAIVIAVAYALNKQRKIKKHLASFTDVERR